jgi:hypothetical protein
MARVLNSSLHVNLLSSIRKTPKPFKDVQEHIFIKRLQSLSIKMSLTTRQSHDPEETGGQSNINLPETEVFQRSGLSLK